jgi:hypothetical protein
VQSLALFKEDHATLPPARALIPSVSSTLASASNPSETPHNPPATERLGAYALYNAPGDAFSSVFTASSGERVRFRQHDGQWRAVLAPGISLNEQEDTLPVVSSGNIGALLSSLQGQDAWSSRSRIHVLATPTAPYSPCVYVGKVGLLGGAPSDRVVEWRPGPHIRLSTSNDARTEVYHIPLPSGYRYWGYRERPGSVVQRASCTIRYVEANSAEEISRLEQYTDESSLEARLSADFAGGVVNLGTLGGGGQGAQSHGRQGGHAARFTHAALVVYVSTKRNRVFKKESKVDVQLEIGIERIDEDAPSPPRPFVPARMPQPFVPATVPQSVECEFREELAHLAAQQAASLRREAEREKQAEEDRKKIAAAEALRKEEERKEEERKAALQKQAEELKREAEQKKQAEEDRKKAAEDALRKEASALLAKKLASPAYVLSESESIVLLTSCVSDGVANAQQIEGKEAVIVLGNTGAGKSTFVNYMLGCELIQKSPKELGIKGIKKIVVVKSKLEGGRCDEVMPIGHSKTSKTFMPQIAIDPLNLNLAYCDCPGF